MARPQRNNVDYFPFYCNEGKTMYFIEQKYGNDGFATWIKILRELATVDYHFLNLSNEVEMMYLSAKCKVDIVVLENIINDLVKMNQFDAELWNENKIIFSEKFIESIKDAYIKRSNEIINKKSLFQLLIAKGIRKPLKSNPKQPKSKSKGDVNPQSKEYYTKEEKIKEEFKNFIDLYPGSKRGLDTEYKNMKKKHKDYREIIPQLEGIIKNQIAAKNYKKQRGEFVPYWKNLQTWINNRSWEEVFESVNDKKRYNPKLTNQWD